jgi:hypothetical protein
LNSAVYTRRFVPFFPICFSPYFVLLAYLSVHQMG